MRSVSFAEFYAACVDRLSEEQLRELKPFSNYYRLGSNYVELVADTRGLWISLAVGGPRIIWALRDLALKIGAPQVGWLCSRDNPSYKIAIYYKAQIEDSGNKSFDGAPMMRCIIQTQQTQRMKKNAKNISVLV